ncbi:hypothetical protein [Streptacidiphilus sp. MAP12-16]|uniref:hypothetical protein n=1 Tax=Streptacidiphilus sp. MAP12-16 TaxID=3156300 RepID=UPI0035125937
MNPTLSQDGLWGPDTRAAAVAFQYDASKALQLQGITIDRAVGQHTGDAIVELGDYGYTNPNNGYCFQYLPTSYN